MKNTAIAFDIDGTLLNDNRNTSDKDFNTLTNLGNDGVLRIAATGRNLLSLKRVLNDKYPVDYAVFSSGAGIINWKTKEIIHTSHLESQNIENIIAELTKLNLDFLIKEPIPESHNMHYHFSNSSENDLMNYLSNYSDFCKPLDFNNIPTPSTQIIALIDNQKHLYESFVEKLPEVKTILTTSPIDRKTLWLEFFNRNVSKANGVLSIIKQYSISKQNTMSIGNDYNDMDMLTEFENSFIVSNSPEELKKRFEIVPSNNESGFSEAVSIFLNTKQDQNSCDYLR